MTEFEPLRETSASAFEQALLRSADRDEASPRAFTKTATALGVGGAVLSSAGNTVAAAGTSTAGTAAATFWTVTLKPLLIGAVGGLVVAVSSHRLSTPSDSERAPTPNVEARAPLATAPSPAVTTSPRTEFPDPSRESATSPSRRETAQRESSPNRALTPRPSSPSVASPKAVPEASPPLVPTPELRASERPAAATAAPGSSVSIASELANVDRARQALREGRAADALHELDVYRVAWPGGVLATEAAVLRIEAHLALGDRTSGVRAARAFLSANPSGRYAARVRALFKPTELE